VRKLIPAGALSIPVLWSALFFSGGSGNMFLLFIGGSIFSLLQNDALKSIITSYITRKLYRKVVGVG
jgi:hypothetical protein